MAIIILKTLISKVLSFQILTIYIFIQSVKDNEHSYDYWIS